MEMKKYKLGELCNQDEIGIYGIPATAEEFSEEKIRYLRITDISDDGILLDDDKKSVSDDNIEKYILKEGDIVFARTGNSTGRAYLYDKKDGILAFAGFLIKYGLDKNKVNPKFLRYYTIGNTYKQWVKNLSVGSTRGNISAKTFAECPISLPDRNQQDFTVDVLSSLDDKIALNRRMNAKLEQMAKRLYVHWFVQFDFPNADGKPYKASGGKMLWNETLKCEIPEGWEVIQIKDIATLERGISYSKENLVDAGTPMISLASFSPDSSYKENCIKYYQGDIDSCDYLNPYDVLMCTTQQTDIDNVTDIIGKCIVVPDVFREQAVFTTDLVKVKVEQNLGLIISCETKLPWYNKYITGFASGTSIKHLNTAGFLNYSIALPKDVDIINKFANIIMNFKRQQSVIMKETQKLTALRDRLLPLLMNGQVEVK